MATNINDELLYEATHLGVEGLVKINVIIVSDVFVANVPIINSIKANSLFINRRKRINVDVIRVQEDITCLSFRIVKGPV